MGGADPARGHAGWQMACARRTPRAAAPALTVVMLVAVGALVAAGAAAGTSYASGGAEGERQRLGGSAVAATTCNTRAAGRVLPLTAEPAPHLP